MASAQAATISAAGDVQSPVEVIVTGKIETEMSGLGAEQLTPIRGPRIIKGFGKHRVRDSVCARGKIAPLSLGKR